MNMKYAIIFPILLTLTGCVTDGNPQLVVNKPVLTLPPSELMNCPQTKLPNKFNSNKDVAKLIVRQRADNLTCKHNMDSVKSFLTQEQGVINSTP